MVANVAYCNSAYLKLVLMRGVKWSFGLPIPSRIVLITRALLVFMLGALANGSIRAEHVDLAPISQDVVQSIVGRWAAPPSNPTVEVLRQRLIEAETLLTELESTTDKRSTKSKGMLLQGAIQQLKVLQEDVRTIVLENQDALEDNSVRLFKILRKGDRFEVVENPETAGIDDYLARVEQRFTNVIGSLENVSETKGPGRKDSIRKALALLRGFRARGPSGPGQVDQAG